MYVPTYGSDDAEVLAERTNTTELLKLPKAAVEQVKLKVAIKAKLSFQKCNGGYLRKARDPKAPERHRCPFACSPTSSIRVVIHECSSSLTWSLLFWTVFLLAWSSLPLEPRQSSSSSRRPFHLAF